jgi:hypothetical protein
MCQSNVGLGRDIGGVFCGLEKPRGYNSLTFIICI